MAVHSQKFQLKKEEILLQGINVMWEKGYNGTSVKDIVDAAGIPKGSFYVYFKSKEDFAEEALTFYTSSNDNLTADILGDQSLSPLQRIRRLFEKRIIFITSESCGSRGCMLTNLTAEVAGKNARFSEIVNQRWEKHKEPLIKALGEAIEIGEISSSHSPEQLAEFIESAYRGTVITYKANKDEKILKDFSTFLFEVILK